MHYAQQDKRRWWRVEGDKSGMVWANATTLKEEQAARVQRMCDWHQLYTDCGIDGGKPRDVKGLFRDRLTRFNVCQNAVDTVHAKITKNKPRPWIVTVGGNWKLRNKAKKQTKYLDGEFTRVKVHEKTSEAYLDALIYGTGALKFYEHEGRPAAERVWCAELFVDPLEEARNHVRTLYQIKSIDREVLAEMYPEHAGIIDAAAPADDEAGLRVLGDMVSVVEAWHLPSGKNAKDGRHVICVSGGCLLDEEWEHDHFPFVFVWWAKDPRRFWGIGLVERMAGVQSDINKLSSVIADAYNLMVPHVQVETNSGIDVGKLENEPGVVIEYTTTPAIFEAPAAVSPDFLQREDALIQRAYNLQAISQLTAQAQKPAGLNSGKALLVHQDVESERFVATGRAWEQLHVDAARLIIEISEQIVEDDPSELVVYVGKSIIEELKYTDVRMGEAPYDLRTYPVSSLSQTPQGKLQDIQDLITLGVVTDPNDIRELLDFPDLEQFSRVASAGRELAEKLIEKALDGERVEANPYMDLQYAHRRAVLEHDLAAIEGAPEESLDNLRDLMGHIEALMKDKQAQEAAAAAAMQAQAAPPMPMGPPMPEQPMPMMAGAA